MADFLIMLLIPFLFWTGLNLFVVRICRRSFWECMPLSMMGAAFILYVSQLLSHSFHPGFWLLVALAAVGFLYLFFFVTHRKEQGRRIWTGIAVFFVVVCLCLLWDWDHHFASFDEFYFWGGMVKESLRLDHFYSVPQSTLWIHKDYPPFITMLELLWCLLTGGYSEAKLLLSVHVFLMSMLVLPLSALFHENGRHRKIRTVLTVVVLFFFVVSVLLAFDPWPKPVTTSILMDIATPVVFVWAMLTVRRSFPRFGWFECLAMAGAASTLLMMKQIGAAFVLVLYFYVFCLFFFCRTKKVSSAPSVVPESSSNESKTGGSRRISRFCRIMIPVLVPATFYLSWKLYIHHLHIGGQFQLPKGFLGLYFESFHGSGLRHDTLRSYIDALFQKSLSRISWLPVTYAAAFVLVMLAIALLARFFRNTYSRREAAVTAAAFICGTFGYAFLMSVLYLFCFNETEMKALASFERYMASYVLAEVLFLLIRWMTLLKESKPSYFTMGKMAALAAIFAVCLNPSNLYYMIPQVVRGNAAASYEREADFVRGKTRPGAVILAVYDSSKISPSWYGAYDAYLQYYLNDRIISRSLVNAYNMDLHDADAVEKLRKAVAESDYIYLKDSTDELTSLLESWTGETMETGEVYQLNK